MKTIQIFTKEDIEKFGFVYEPDETKCKIRKIAPLYSSFDTENGIVVRSGAVVSNEGFVEEDFKQEIIYWGQETNFKYINSIYGMVAEVGESVDTDIKSNGHWDVRAMVKGH